MTGRAVDLRDTLIAGIALARWATIATRNTRHFFGLDVPVVNPWTNNGRRAGREAGVAQWGTTINLDLKPRRETGSTPPEAA